MSSCTSADPYRECRGGDTGNRRGPGPGQGRVGTASRKDIIFSAIVHTKPEHANNRYWPSWIGKGYDHLVPIFGATRLALPGGLASVGRSAAAKLPRWGLEARERRLATVLKRIREAVRDRLVRVVDEVITAHRRELEVTLAGYHAELQTTLSAHRIELQTALTAEVDRAIKAVHDVESRSRRDLLAAGDRAAAASSERFAREAMPTAPTFGDPIATLEHALSLAPAEGMALEFGVATGRTLTVIAAARGNKQVFGFDSFEGLPEDWRTNIPAGTFKIDSLPDVPGAELVVGLFEDTLPDFLASHAEPVAFVHLDADLYSSTATVFEHVGSRLRPGSVIVFDEYFNYPGWQQHEHRAWQEFVAQSAIEFRFVAYTCDDEQVALIVTKV